MQQKYDPAQDALSIAREFCTVQDLGDRERFLKVMVKMIPPQDYQRFFHFLSSGLASYGSTLVTVEYERQTDLTPTSIVESFIESLSSLWPTKARQTFSKLRREILQTTLPQGELRLLLNECIDLTKESLGHTVIVLFHWHAAPFTLEALRLIHSLRSLAKTSDFPWCIVSSSPTLMLFMGEVSYPTSFFSMIIAQNFQ